MKLEVERDPALTPRPPLPHDPGRRRAADLFERLLAAGELPNIQKHVIDRGAYRRASSTFTSTTGPAHLPFLTGCFPGTANVPGYRWFDRAAYRPGLPAGPWCMRSYNGPEAFMYEGT